MMPPHCTETSLDTDGIPRSCSLSAGHDGAHMSWTAETWEDPTTVLPRLVSRWGRTHQFAWTGRLWRATDRSPDSHWRTEIEPTPEQLEASLRRHHGEPSGPPETPCGEREKVSHG